MLVSDLLATYDQEGNPQLPDNFIIPYPMDLMGLFMECGFSITDCWGVKRADFVQIVGTKKR